MVDKIADEICKKIDKIISEVENKKSGCGCGY